MNKAQFELLVKTIVSKEDFDNNKHLLEEVDTNNYNDYVNCLKLGANMHPAFKSMDMIIQISRQTALCTEDVIELIPKFRLLISFFDMRQS